LSAGSSGRISDGVNNFNFAFACDFSGSCLGRDFMPKSADAAFLGILPLILQQFPQNFGNAWFSLELCR